MLRPSLFLTLTLALLTSACTTSTPIVRPTPCKIIPEQPAVNKTPAAGSDALLHWNQWLKSLPTDSKTPAPSETPASSNVPK